MKTTNVCLGCFSEWEEKNGSCLHCGWNSEPECQHQRGWAIGKVLEKRYLVGKVFYEADDMTVWRLYDNLLEIPCFALLSAKNKIKDLLLRAHHMQTASTMVEKFVVIMSVKEIDKKTVLIFSLKNRFMKKDIFKKMLHGKSVPSSDILHDIRREEDCEQDSRELRKNSFLQNRYRVIRCIGIGGFGITYLCEDIFLHRYVAIKEYFPSQWAEREEEYVVVKKANDIDLFRFGLQSFLKEVRITAKFIHTPHVVSIYDAFEANDTAYLVMEYVSGMSIGREMRQRGYKPYTPAEMAEIMFPVLDGMAEIHEKHIIHSDISPGNIMRSEQGEICLIDMGASKYNLESQPALSATFLKVEYAAPEQYRTAREGIPKDEGPWTDIYSLGATMYYLLTGHKPLDVVTRLSGKTTALVSPKKYRVKVSRKWMKLINRAMALEKNERFHSAQELKIEMQKILDG